MHNSEMIQALESSGDYKVIERLKAPTIYCQGEPAARRTGIVIDVEATGLDTRYDKIIELGFVVFEYDAATGLIYRVTHRYGGFEDPGEPLSDIVKQITGISDEMLKDQSLDDNEVNEWLAKADLIIAHNAAFDRQMLERRFPVTASANWACTMQEIDWSDEDINSLKLDYIAYKLGFFFEGHRALNDAEATLHLLTKPLSVSKTPAMKALLDRARGKSRRFFAIAAPFDRKDDLKARGYRWLGEFSYLDRGKQKKGVWSKPVAECDSEAEQLWLSETVYAGRVPGFSFKDVSAKDRYSIREFEA